MAFDLTIPAEANPTNTQAMSLYVRGTGMQLDLVNGMARAPFVGYASEEARHAGKQPVYAFEGLDIGPVVKPPTYDAQTGKQIRGKVPSLTQLLGVFGDEFNQVSTILYCLAKRIDPELSQATTRETDFDEKYVAEIEAKLDTLLK